MPPHTNPVAPPDRRPSSASASASASAFASASASAASAAAGRHFDRRSASPESSSSSSSNAVCKNCNRFAPTPFRHSFCAALDQCKNQVWQSPGNGWIVTPTSVPEGQQALAGAAFCSGDCLFRRAPTPRALSCRRQPAAPLLHPLLTPPAPPRSYLFSGELLSNKYPDRDLHFFKRSDEQHQWVGSQLARLDEPPSDGTLV